MRLGPLDFDAKSKLQAIYTTNVENERPSEAKADREDFYLVVGLDLIANAPVAPNTDLKIDTGVFVERHLNREDLNDSSNPFARARINTATEISRYTLLLEAGYERTSESQEETAFFGGESRLTRRVKDAYSYAAQLKWEYDPFMLAAKTDFLAERFVDEDEQINDKDDTGYLYEAEWEMTRRLTLAWSFDRKLTEMINQPDDDPMWDETQRILLRMRILDKPNFTYSFGYEKADTGGEEGEWDPIHNFNLSDDYQINPALKLAGFVTYEYDPDPEEDRDIAFTYGVNLSHEISRTAQQVFSFSREPVDTFGSTATTDSTTYQYRFKKEDLFIYNLSFDASVSYKIEEQLDTNEKNKTWNYSAGVAHRVPLSRQLTRSLEYRYTAEDDQDEEELLDEHRVTLTYEYRF